MPADDQPIIDAAVYRQLQDTAGADFAAELVGTFLEETPTMLQQLRDSLAGGEADEFRRAAHSLKSNSLTFGATALAALARTFEVNGLTSADAASLAALQAEFDRSAAALEALANDD